MACGFLVTSVLFMIFCYLTRDISSANQFKKKHPILSIIFLLIGGYFITYMFGSFLIFVVGILLPITGNIDSKLEKFV